MNPLIIRAELSAPPSIRESFRDLTMYAKIRYAPDILLEIDKEWIDFYYHWAKERGLLDFVDQFVSTDEESGVYVDNILRPRPRTVFVDRIVPSNLRAVLGEAGALL